MLAEVVENTTEIRHKKATCGPVVASRRKFNYCALRVPQVTTNFPGYDSNGLRIIIILDVILA